MPQTYLEWLQTDPCFNRVEAWSEEQFPAASYRFFRDAGCLVCSLAVMLRHYGIEPAVQEGSFDPWILNRRLIECDAFSPAADLELSRINRLYPLEYLGAVPYSGNALKRFAENGFPCLITVPGEKAERHFTALLAMLPDDAIVFDPVRGEKRLSTYELLCEIRLYFVYPWPQIRQHPAFIEEARTDPKREICWSAIC